MLPKNRSLALAISIAGFVLAVFVALFPFTSSGLQIEEGEIATRTIRAPSNISFISETQTDQRAEEAAAAIPDKLIFDPSIGTAQQQRFRAFTAEIQRVLEQTNLNDARTAFLQNIPDLSVSLGSLSILVELEPRDIAPIEEEGIKSLSTIYESSFPPSAVSAVKEQAATYVSDELNRELSTLIAELIRPFITSNQAVDEVATLTDRDEARAAVLPVQVTYAENQIIVEEGGEISTEAREALLAARVIEDRFWRWEKMGASGLLAVISAGAVLAGVVAFRPRISPQELLVMGLTVAIPVFVMKLYLPFILPDEGRHFLAYLMPVAAAAMVLAAFLGAELALLASGLIAFLSAFAAVLLLDLTLLGTSGALEVARIAMATGIASAAGVFAVRKAERISQFLLGGLVVGLSVFAVLVATWLIDPGRQLGDLPWILLVAAVNGGVCAFLAAGIYVTMGSIFGVTTRLQLLEMSQLSQPLLLRLQDEAPSTFQHSVIVANLAEKGAHIIGADALLARVGCYYHDIGKLARPGFFIENQLGGENPHDHLDPADSARIISDHVRDGLNLAREYHLPEKVAQFVPEHHGTRMVAFFYRRAAEEDPTINIDNFRYPGPKPQSRETAIAMLADSCEAAVRSSPDHSAERIDALVEDIFNERLSEGELDESNLTLNNVRALAASFKSTLKAIYHPRVEYPAPTEAEMLLRRLPFRRLDEPDSTVAVNSGENNN